MQGSEDRDSPIGFGLRKEDLLEHRSGHTCGNSDRAFIIVTYLLVPLGLWATYLSEAVSLSAIIGVGVLWFLSLLRTLRRGRPLHADTQDGHAISPGFKNIIGLIIIVYFLIDVLYISSSMLTTAVRLLLVAQVVKLFDINNERDLFQIVIIVFFQFLSVTSNTSTLILLPLFIVAFILTFLWLVLHHFKNEERDALELIKGGDCVSGVHRWHLTPAFFISTGLISLASFLMTLLFFFIMPRVEVGFFQHRASPLIRVAGFSEEIDLGEIGEIKLSPSVVMRVEFPTLKREPSIQPHWRGRAFDFFDGYRWIDTIGGKRMLMPEEGSFRIGDGGIENLLIQQIILEPIDTSVLFTAPNSVRLVGDFPYLKIDRNGSISLPRPPSHRLEYTVFSRINEDKGRKETVSKAYLQMPEGMEEAAALAGRITEGISEPEDKVKAIGAYLKDNFKYNLYARWDAKRPVQSFLFETKEGYCEQFATAMAIMLRSVGVPTRLVTGFLSGEWNGFGNYYLVRQKDAHSWVEAYMPGRGWLTFDPTPAVEVPSTYTGALLPYLSLFLDSMRLMWSRYIIRYSINDQQRVMEHVRERTFRIRDRSETIIKGIKDGIKGLRSMAYPVFIITGLVILLFLLYRFGRDMGFLHRYRSITEGDGIKDEAIRIYRDMLKILKRRGIEKSRSMTPLEFLCSLTGLSQDELSAIGLITHAYYTMRFGEAGSFSLSRDDLREAFDTIRQ